MLYVLDEPTTGLHFDDIVKLIAAFKKLLHAGHSLLVIEHNLDVLKTADWIIDLGPEGGDAGGAVVAFGTPEHIATVAASHTGLHMLIKMDAGLYRVLDIHHLTPGNKRGHVQCRLRDIRSNRLSDYKFRSEDNVERATLDEHEMQFLYREGELFFFMRSELDEIAGIGSTTSFGSS